MVTLNVEKQSLSVLADGAHPFVGPDTPGVLLRRVTPDVSEVPKLRRRYVVPDLKLVDPSWVGRLPGGHPSLTAINAARVGDPVTLTCEGDRWLIQDAGGRTLGLMSRAFTPPEGMALERAEVAAVMIWRAEDGGKAWSHLNCRPE